MSKDSNYDKKFRKQSREKNSIEQINEIAGNFIHLIRFVVSIQCHAMP